MAVPRSGCMAISTVGRKMSTSDPSTLRFDGGRVRSLKNQATMAGTASFISSAGWKRPMPGRLSQRWAPLASVPTRITSASRTRPTPYTRGAQKRNVLGGSCASTSITSKPPPKRMAWRITVSMLPPLAL